MKPVNLTLQNYRAFAETQLDLSRIEAGTITGPNGAGKSSVVEAMIWSLFGDNRSSGVDGVVRLGSDEASVQLDYRHNGSIYRVIRKRRRAGKSDLQYLVGDTDAVGDGLWRPLSGATMRETQEKIVHDLGLDAALFRASSCVMQGDSAGICEATPAERKAVLYAVLEDRLGKFAPLHEAAKATVKALDEAQAVNRAKGADLERLVAAEPEWLEMQQDAEGRLSGLREDSKAAEEELRGWQVKAAEVETNQTRLDEVNRNLMALASAGTSIRQAISSYEEEIARNGRTLAAREEIEAKCAEHDKVKAELETINEKGREYSALDRRLREIEHRQQVESIERASHIRELQAKHASLVRDRESARDTEITQTSAEMDRLRTQIERLESVPCQGVGEYAGCELIADAVTAKDRLPQLEEALQIIPLTRAETDEEKALFAEIVTAQKQTLEGSDTERADLQGRMDALGYDKSRHELLIGDVHLLQAWPAKREGLAAAAAANQVAERAVREKREELAAKRAEHDQAVVERDRLAKIVEQAANVKPALMSAEARVETVRAEIERVTADLAITRERLARVAQARTEMEGLAAQAVAVDHHRRVYATLQEAFGRDGIPALIIDAAVPAIEEVANDILRSLSDGRMSLKLVTQKLKVTGGIAETLDIIVADSAGERLFEDWSGGEQLRISLAIRIALGRVLAQRTGSRIELLILDEVCAPLDVAGEDALVDVINRLRADFGCILLITHRESLRDRLPQQITVRKNGTGSVVEVRND